MRTPSPRLIHRLFSIGIVIKGIDGVLEMIGGLLLLVISRSHLNDLVVFFTQRELSQDPDDPVSNFLLNLSAHFSVRGKIFAVTYLLAHGVIKVLLCYHLRRENVRFFPWAIGVLSAFVLYQGYRLIEHFAWGLFTLTCFDAIIIFAVWREYRMRKRSLEAAATSEQLL
jgi:uncharacterized membrane protein